MQEPPPTPPNHPNASAERHDATRILTINGGSSSIKFTGSEAAKGRIILAHLGNGASLAAVRDGKPIDTSTGFTPTAGIPMRTHSGDLDPGLLWYLARTEGLDAKRFNEMVNFQSGLLGVSEISSDMRDLLQREAQDERAADAIAMFCYYAKKFIGAFAAALGGLDTLVFAGGIGEHAQPDRAIPTDDEIMIARAVRSMLDLHIQKDPQLEVG